MHVLLATDDSSEAKQATNWLRAFPLPDDAAVSVVTVATLMDPPSSAQSVSALRQTLQAEAMEAAERAAAFLKERWRRVTTVVAEGDARVEILHVADEVRADMVVVGARGLGRIKRLLGGSTSLAVARYARCSVAVVPEGRQTLRRVLVGLDDSSASRAALAFLSRFAIAAETSLILLHVLREDSREVSAPNERSVPDQLLADGATVLGERRCSMERMVARGDAAGEIVRVARERDVDLVVLGVRGLRTLGRFFLGSVSEAVLHHAGRPVIVAREPG
jgi:nucleotide-binding universal stress UspA family protein